MCGNKDCPLRLPNEVENGEPEGRLGLGTRPAGHKNGRLGRPSGTDRIQLARVMAVLSWLRLGPDGETCVAPDWVASKF